MAPEEVGIELSADPYCMLRYDVRWTCEECGGHFFFDFKGKSPEACCICEFSKLKKDTFLLFGWRLTRTKNQVIVARLPR